MSDTPANHFDIAVIGLGPVGSLGALLFAEAGLRVVAIEKDTEVYRLPRAVNLDGEICLLYTSPSPRDIMRSRMPSSA